MIRLYWPYKKVPEYLEVVRFYKAGKPATGDFYHYGFGIVVKASGSYLVWAAAGTFMKVDASGNDVEISGGGKGVDVYFSFCAWIKAVARAVKYAH